MKFVLSMHVYLRYMNSLIDIFAIFAIFIAVASRGAAVSLHDPDLMPINFKIFQKILNEASFSSYMKTAVPFGRKGK